MATRALVAFVLPLMVSCAASRHAGRQEDLERLLSWWASEYTNAAQVREQARAGVPPADRNAALTLHLRRVDLPAFGRDVFYAEWNGTGTGQSPPVRQRLYAFERGAAPGTIVLRLHIWPADNPGFVARTAGAHRDPSRLAGVTPRNMAPLPGCDVTFHRADDAFIGAMEKGTCRFPSFEEPEVTIYSWSQMALTADEFRYKDGWFHLDGRPYREFGADWYRFRRVGTGAPTR